MHANNNNVHMFMFLFEVTTCLTSGDESYMCFSFRVDDRLLVFSIHTLLFFSTFQKHQVRRFEWLGVKMHDFHVVANGLIFEPA